MRRHTLCTAVLVLAAVTAVVGGAGAVAATPAGAVAPASHDSTTVAGDACAFPVTRTDATGTDVTVSEAPDRIVVVGASGAQTMWELGAKERVVGMTRAPYTAYLNGSEAVPDVTDSSGYANVEKVLARDPDLVLLANIQKNGTAETLREAGIPTYKFRAATSIDDIYAKTRLTGRLVGACAEANDTVAWMRDRVETVREAADGEPRPSILAPSPSNYVPGPGSFVHDVMTTAGTHNVVANGNFSSSYPHVTNEFVVQQNPEWLLVSYDPSAVNGAVEDPKQYVPDNDALRQTAAWEEGHVVAVNRNYLNQPGPRVVYPLTKLARAVHPEAYAAANGSTVPTGTTGPAETTETAGTTGTTDTSAGAQTTASGGAPGFTALTALAGLVALFGWGLSRSR